MIARQHIATIFNVAGLQIGWFACALGAADHQPWIGPAVVAVYMGLHLYFVKNRRREAGLLLLAGLFGTAVDGMKRLSGLVIYESAVPAIDWLAPVWITAMRVLFASTLNSSLSWLKGRYALAAFTGALFGPLSYFGGSRLGAISFSYDWGITIGALALIWAAVMPVLMRMSELPANRQQPPAT